MDELLVVGAIIAAAWFILVFLRVPAFAAFFSLLVGQMLSAQASTDAYEFIGGVINIPEIRYAQIGLMLLPLLLTILFLRGHVAKSKLGIEIIPSLFVVLVGILLVSPLLPGLERVVYEASQGQIDQYKTIILIAASVSGLLSAWISYPKPHSDKKKHR